MNDYNEELIHRRVAKELDLEPGNVAKTVSLLNEGNTIPFLARYRKEITGGMTDEQLRFLVEKLALNRNLESRRRDILRLLEELAVLTPELESAVQKASSVTELEDLYRPFRPRKRTRATMAREKGLEPLARLLLQGEKDPGRDAHKYLDAEKEVLSADEALGGARAAAPMKCMKITGSPAKKSSPTASLP